MATPIKWKASAAERAVLVMGKGQVAERVKVLAHRLVPAKQARNLLLVRLEPMPIPAMPMPTTVMQRTLLLQSHLLHRPIAMAHQQAKEVVRP